MERVRAGMVWRVDEDGTYLEQGEPYSTRGSLCAGHGIACVDGLFGVDGVGGKAGADDVDAVQPLQGADSGGIPHPGEVVVGDRDLEVLFNILVVGFAADPYVSARPAASESIWADCGTSSATFEDPC